MELCSLLTHCYIAGISQSCFKIVITFTNLMKMGKHSFIPQLCQRTLSICESICGEFLSFLNFLLFLLLYARFYILTCLLFFYYIGYYTVNSRTLRYCISIHFLNDLSVVTHFKSVTIYSQVIITFCKVSIH
mgnify:CR=1 FL=1